MEWRRRSVRLLVHAFDRSFAVFAQLLAEFFVSFIRSFARLFAFVLLCVRSFFCSRVNFQLFMPKFCISPLQTSVFEFANKIINHVLVCLSFRVLSVVQQLHDVRVYEERTREEFEREG